MSIKIKMQIYLILLGSVLILLNIFLDNLSLGKIWYYLNANSLVGIQSFSEKVENLYRGGFLFNEIIIILLNMNLLFLLGVLSIIISFVLFLFLRP
jgi:hypothetical protein